MVGYIYIFPKRVAPQFGSRWNQDKSGAGWWDGRMKQKIVVGCGIKKAYFGPSVKDRGCNNPYMGNRKMENCTRQGTLEGFSGDLMRHMV